MSDLKDPAPIATPEQYRAALLAVRQRMTDVHLKMLQAHCRSEGHSISTDHLAELVGIRIAISAKTTYSNYAHWIADALEYVPEPSAKKQTWLYALAHGRPDATEKVDGKYEWIMRPELVTALQAMKWA